MFIRSLLLAGWLTAVGLAGPSVKECRTVYLHPMPESLHEFVGVELLKWGAMKAVTAEDKADCVAMSGRQATKTEVRTSGTSVLPADASVQAESAREELPATSTAFLGTRKSAALTLVHRETGEVMWAEAVADGWFSGGAKVLAKKLVAQLKKDFGSAVKTGPQPGRR